MMSVVHAQNGARGIVRHQVHRLRGAFLDDPSRRQRHPFRRRVHPLAERAAGRARAPGAQATASSCRRHTTFNVGTIVGGTAGNILARECEVLWGYRELPGDADRRKCSDAPAYVAELAAAQDEGQASRRQHRHGAAAPSSRLLAGGERGGQDAARCNGPARNDLRSVPLRHRGRHLPQDLGMPTVVCGPGDIAQAHQPNEFLLPRRWMPATPSCDAWWSGPAGIERIADLLSRMLPRPHPL